MGNKKISKNKINLFKTHLFVDSDNSNLSLISNLKVVSHKKKNMWKFLIILLILSIVSFGTYEFWKFREQKKLKEIEQIKQKPAKEKFNTSESCEVYSLRAIENGYYPCYNCGNENTIYLFKGEIWKYGKTCIGEEKRYGNLDELSLIYKREFTGTEKECLIIEKEKIYNYPSLPECLKRKQKLIRPAGNKIDR